MTESTNDPIPYRVSYSERVRNELKGLFTRAKQGGLGPQFLAALKEIDRRLHIYPQFGEPLRDLKLKPLQRWIGVVPPLVVQYCVDDDKRLVMVGVPIQPLPNSGLDS